MLRRFIAACLLTTVAATGCGASTNAGASPLIVATTTQVADFARNVAGPAARVVQLLPANAEAHDFEPTPSDINAIADATAIIASGAGLDRWIDRLRDGAGSDAPLIDASVGTRRITRDGTADPHIWMDPRNAIVMVANIRDGLMRADPDHALDYRRNARRYIATLRSLDRSLLRQIEAVPAASRRIVTDHDALGYFADRYGITIVATAIPSMTAGAEPSARDLAAVIDAVTRERVRVVFPEAGVNPQVARSIARETGASVGGELFGDSLGAPGSGAATYVDMMRSNMRTLIASLRHAG